MIRLGLLISTILLLFLPSDNRQMFGVRSINLPTTNLSEMRLSEIGLSDMSLSEIRLSEMQLAEKDLTPMEALDLVKEQYAYDFVRVETEQADEYYYRLPDAGLYLVYEGGSMDTEFYFVHLYELVEDTLEPGYGHCYTFRWYSVHKKTGKIMDVTN